jgi:hypothetical protein
MKTSKIFLNLFYVGAIVVFSGVVYWTHDQHIFWIEPHPHAPNTNDSPYKKRINSKCWWYSTIAALWSILVLAIGCLLIYVDPGYIQKWSTVCPSGYTLYPAIQGDQCCDFVLNNTITMPMVVYQGMENTNGGLTIGGIVVSVVFTVLALLGCFIIKRQKEFDPAETNEPLLLLAVATGDEEKQTHN